ncbi:MAG: MFS transporter [Chloroflexi bacterium]|nr:MAG: MFS transporter [Chloroflexota bacterium]MBL1197349.1 MFS transporter [Chloroflexota bacterium]NOH14646.1 MFS transporter [Chloroflexota bacterium]
MLTGSYSQILSIPSFRNFWVGFTLSSVGDGITLVALNWYVWETTQSPQALGLLAFFYTGPVVIGGFLAGWLLDRFDRRKVILIDNLLRGTIMLSIPLLHLLGWLQIWHIYVVVAFYGSMMMISLAGGPSLVPSLVEPRFLNTANALETFSFTLGSVLGPPLAGILIGFLAAPNVVLIDALTYFAFAFLLSRVRSSIPEGMNDQIKEDTPNLSYMQSVRLFIQDKVLLSTTLMFMAVNVGFGFAIVWLPVYADQTLSGGAQLYGLLLGAIAAGQVLTAFLAGLVTLSITLGFSIALTQLVAGLAFLPLLLGPQRWLAFLSLTIYGLSTGPLTVWAQTLRMKIIPPELRGRTFALLRTIMMSGHPIGGLIAGGLLPLIGLPAMILLSALLTGIPGLLGTQVRALRQSDG